MHWSFWRLQYRKVKWLGGKLSLCLLSGFLNAFCSVVHDWKSPDYLFTQARYLCVGHHGICLQSSDFWLPSAVRQDYRRQVPSDSVSGAVVERWRCSHGRGSHRLCQAKWCLYTFAPKMWQNLLNPFAPLGNRSVSILTLTPCQWSGQSLHQSRDFSWPPPVLAWERGSG